MPALKYTGPADVRLISATDFKRVGVDDQNQVHVDKRDLKVDWNVVEVSEQAAKYLLENEPKTWVQVKDEEAPEPKDK